MKKDGIIEGKESHKLIQLYKIRLGLDEMELSIKEYNYGNEITEILEIIKKDHLEKEKKLWKLFKEKYALNIEGYERMEINYKNNIVQIH